MLNFNCSLGTLMSLIKALLLIILRFAKMSREMRLFSTHVPRATIFGSFWAGGQCSCSSPTSYFVTFSAFSIFLLLKGLAWSRQCLSSELQNKPKILRWSHCFKTTKNIFVQFYISVDFWKWRTWRSNSATIQVNYE